MIGQVMKQYLSSKTRISSPVLKVSSLSSAASKSYSARTFRASCPPLPLVQFGGSEDTVRGRVSACCFCSCKDSSMAGRGGGLDGRKREQKTSGKEKRMFVKRPTRSLGTDTGFIPPPPKIQTVLRRLLKCKVKIMG